LLFDGNKNLKRKIISIYNKRLEYLRTKFLSQLTESKTADEYSDEVLTKEKSNNNNNNLKI